MPPSPLPPPYSPSPLPPPPLSSTSLVVFSLPIKIEPLEGWWISLLPKVSLMLEHSSFMFASGPRNHNRTSSASSVRFFPSNQRGDCGMGIIRIRTSVGGIAPIKASHLQWHRTPVARHINTPNVKLRLLRLANTPRTRAAAISAMYT